MLRTFCPFRWWAWQWKSFLYLPMDWIHFAVKHTACAPQVFTGHQCSWKLTYVLGDGWIWSGWKAFMILLNNRKIIYVELWAERNIENLFIGNSNFSTHQIHGEEWKWTRINKKIETVKKLFWLNTNWHLFQVKDRWMEMMVGK